MPSVGDVLTRPDGYRIRLAGVSNGAFVAEPLNEFGTPFRISAGELTGVYGVIDPAAPSEDSYSPALAARDAAATDHAIREYGRTHPDAVRARRRERQLAEAGVESARPPVGSPEHVFAEAANEPQPD